MGNGSPPGAQPARSSKPAKEAAASMGNSKPWSGSSLFDSIGNRYSLSSPYRHSCAVHPARYAFAENAGKKGRL